LITFGFELALLAIIYVSRQSGKMRLGPAIAFVLVVASLIAWLGVGRDLERFSTKGLGEVTVDRRWTMTKGTLRVFLAHPVTGAGLGTLAVEFPRYDTGYDGKLVDHAHNDYAELLAELGLPGAICGIAFLWLLLQASIRALQRTQGHFSVAYHIAALVACAGLLLHSFVDFNLHIPSNALLFIIQAGLLASPPLTTDPVNSRKQMAWTTKSVVDIHPSASA
jgi:O-antigen ligase